MSREDSAIWHRWYPTLDPKPLEMYFDVGLGAGRPLQPGASDADAAMWLRLTQKRADALLVFDEHVLVAELRFNASASAIGRLQMYRRLLHDDNPFSQPIHCAVVTNAPDPDLAMLARHARIALIVA